MLTTVEEELRNGEHPGLRADKETWFRQSGRDSIETVEGIRFGSGEILGDGGVWGTID